MIPRLLRFSTLVLIAILLLSVPLGALPYVLSFQGTPALASGDRPLAPPQLPYSPYGTVTIGGRNVHTGTMIGAWCGGVKVIETPSEFAGGQSGYGLDIQEDNSVTPEKDGCVASEIVTFTLGALPGEAHKPDNPGEPVTWVSGVSEQVNLSAEAARIYLPLVRR